ncbi:hypothetical protein TTHERM_00215930 (macronuclear) [Tetrahymena thermophila SB210]|uniref:Uncharacterized protein n=1 Tax=Tetrahymena thermophila (strain SB210) TaxID=312017 RepID=I7LVW2_TETTS|nr:hypothetical protein TTHERM_00215930 [Tetrahymena thermophila SB210]EAS00218.2 hypothetical protein TTHERM_00215930 [Tetrahymena thermophila SB210]|eukprot:XP_001020463.2 hypothetical protein TTHERM_00215930 [Tetrahymena thermophila SB210]
MSFGTPKVLNPYKYQSSSIKQREQQPQLINEVSNSSSGNNLTEITQVLEDNYKSFIKVMYEVYKYEKDPEIKNQKFQLIKKISSSADNDNAIDLNKDYFKDFEEEIIAFILIASFDEIHTFFMRFYGIFDEDQNFKLEKPEIEKILNYMALEEQMGKEKVEYLIEQLLEGSNNGTNTLSLKILQKQQANQLSQDLKDEFFKLYVSKGSKKLENKSLDMKKFFGVLLGFFFQYTRKRIQNRIFYWDEIRGIDNIKGLKTQITGMMTLSYALKRVTGLDYMNKLDRNSKQVSYRHMEQTLQTYKNANRDIQLETISRVLSDIEKFMKVDMQTKIEFRKVKMYKLVDFVSMRIAFHKCCQNIVIDAQNENKSPDTFNFKEEIILWNSCNSKYILKQNKIERSSLKFFEQNQKQNELDLDYEFVVEEFLKSKFQNLDKRSRQNITKNIGSQNNLQQYQIPTQIFEELMYEAQYKIKFYIMKIFSGFGFKISDQIKSDFLNSRGAIKWSLQDSSQQILTFKQSSNYKGSKFQQQALQKKSNEQQNVEEEEEEHDSQDDVQNSKELQTSKFRQQDRQSSIKMQQMGNFLQSDRKSMQNIQFQNNQNRGGDILNACFMMEGLLEKVQYMKKDEIKKLKKQGIQSKINMSDEQDQLQNQDYKSSINVPSSSYIQQQGLSSGSILPKSSIKNRGSQQSIVSKLGGNTYHRQSEAPAILDDLRRIQPDDYQDDILDSISLSHHDQENKQELMNNSVIALMMMNNQKYQRRTEYQNRFPIESNGSQDQILDEMDDFQIKRASSFKRSFQSQNRYGYDQKQNLQTDFSQPKINKDVFVEVRRQQAIDRLSYYQQLQKLQIENNQQEIPINQKEKNSSATDRTCSNCSIF